MFENAKWIQSKREFYKDTKCGVTFFKDFAAKKTAKSAVLSITGLGVYTAQINGRPDTYVFTAKIKIRKIRPVYTTPVGSFAIKIRKALPLGELPRQRVRGYLICVTSRNRF